MTSDDLMEMNRRVVQALWNVVSPTDAPQGLSPRLMFPERRTGEIRVSEQEARLFWCAMLQDTSYCESESRETGFTCYRLLTLRRFPGCSKSS